MPLRKSQLESESESRSIRRPVAFVLDLMALFRSAEAEGTRRSVGEVAGGTAAECAAVACCCPCAVVELVVLAVYKVPAELCKKAWRRTKRRRLARRRKALLVAGPPPAERNLSPLTASVYEDAGDDVSVGSSRHVDEVWPDFYRTGFWRSPDERDDDK